MEDGILIKEILEKNSSEALVELSERHTGIFYNIIQKYLPKYENSSYFDDFESQKESILFDAVRTFDEEKGVKFVTWFANKTKYLCLTERTKQTKSPSFYEFSEEMGGISQETPFSYCDLKDETEEIIRKVKSRFGERNAEIFCDLYFGGEKKVGQTLKQVGEKYGISTQAVQACHKKIINFLKNENTIKLANQ